MTRHVISSSAAYLALLLMLVSALCSPTIQAQANAPPARLTLNDRPIVGDMYTSLDGEWTLTSPAIGSTTLTGRVPGDLISDLVHAKLLPEPMYENNFLVNASLWNNNTWSYTTNITLPAASLARLQGGGEAAGDVWLVFDGIKLGAAVLVNGVQLGVVQAQFQRSNFSLRAVASQLRAGPNTLEVRFDPRINVHGLFMQCSGGWDWAPTSQSVTLDDSHQGVYSRGIWKSVYLVDLSWAAITAMTVHTEYQGAFPTQRFEPHNHGPFLVNVTAHIYAPAATTAMLTINASWSAAPLFSGKVSVPAGESRLLASVPVAAADIDLWWPNGLGAHPLYHVTASLSGATTLVESRRVGFRLFTVSTGNDTDPAWVAANEGADGSGQMGLRYRVNGEAIFTRGANMIPMDELEGRYTAEGHQRVVFSAAEAGMNILRVWAGGVWLPDVFYDSADEVGVMIYEDMKNRWNFDQRPEEIAAYQHQIRRVSSHPALVIYSGCNECFPFQGGAIVPQLLDLVTFEDVSRPIWAACPSEGFRSGVDRLTGLRNGAALVKVDFEMWGPLDTHGPYQHGDGFPAVDGDNNNLNIFDPMTPPHFNASTPVGLQYNHTFTSEFGSVSWSSFESMSTVFGESHWSLHGGSAPDNCTSGTCRGGNVVAQRNYPCDSIVITYWGGKQSQLDEVGEMAFKEQLYKCLLGSSFIIKGYIEQHRAANTFGLMLWQLNEIWPTGGWGSLEWSSGTYPGQVLGGRWKPPHHWLEQYLYKDVIVACGQPLEQRQQSSDALCYVKLDATRGAGTHTITATTVLLSDARHSTTVTMQVDVPAGPGSIAWFTLPGAPINNSVVTLLSVHNAATRVEVTRNFHIAATPEHLAMTPVALGDVQLVVGAADVNGSVPIHVTKKTHAVLLWLTLTTLHPGRFSENSFVVTQLNSTVMFHPWGALDRARLEKSLRVEFANQYAQMRTVADTPRGSHTASE